MTSRDHILGSPPFPVMETMKQRKACHPSVAVRFPANVVGWSGDESGGEVPRSLGANGVEGQRGNAATEHLGLSFEDGRLVAIFEITATDSLAAAMPPTAQTLPLPAPAVRRQS